MEIYKKLLEIQKAVDNFTKDKKSFGYNYASGDQVLNTIRPKMNDLGLLLKQEILESKSTRIDYVNTKGKEKSEMYTELKQKFTWIDVETGEKDECLFFANGMNDWEKGLGSALTYAERYFLLKFFHVPTDGDDVDNHSRRNPQTTQTTQVKSQTKSNNINTIGLDEKKLKHVNTVISKSGLNRDKLKAYYKVSSIKDLTIEQAKELIENANNKIKKQEANNGN